MISARIYCLCHITTRWKSDAKLAVRLSLSLFPTQILVDYNNIGVFSNIGITSTTKYCKTLQYCLLSVSDPILVLQQY